MKMNLKVMREGVHSFHTNCAQKERYNISVRRDLIKNRREKERKERRGRGRKGGEKKEKKGR